MYFSTKRQQFLVDQGYAFKVVTKLEGLDGTGVKSGSGLVYADKGRQIDLLNTVLLASEVDYGRKDVDSDVDLVSENDEEEVEHRETTTSAVIRSNTTLTSLSGGDSMAYLEFKKVYMRRRR